MTPDETRALVAATIRGTRAVRGWSQQRLAAETSVHGADIHPDAFSRLETGHRGIDVGELVAIAAALGVAPADLLEGRVVVTVNHETASAARRRAEGERRQR